MNRPLCPVSALASAYYHKSPGKVKSCAAFTRSIGESSNKKTERAAERSATGASRDAPYVLRRVSFDGRAVGAPSAMPTPNVTSVPIG